MKNGSLHFAKGVIFFVGLAALAVCLVLLPELAREEAVGKPADPFLTYTFLGAAYVLALPFFFGLFQTLKLIQYFGNKQALSVQSIKSLKNIKNSALIFAGFVVIAVIGGISLAKNAHPREDVTFLITISFILLSVASIIAIFVAVLQKLLEDAIKMKSENDLII